MKPSRPARPRDVTIRALVRRHPDRRVVNYAGLVAGDTRKIEQTPELRAVLHDVREISLRGLERVMIEASSSVDME